MFGTHKIKETNSSKESKGPNEKQKSSKSPSVLTIDNSSLSALSIKKPFDTSSSLSPVTPMNDTGNVVVSGNTTENENNTANNHALYPLDVDAINQLLDELSHDYLCMTALSTKLPQGMLRPLVAVFAKALCKVSQSHEHHMNVTSGDLYLRNVNDNRAQDDKEKNIDIEIFGNSRTTPARFLSVLFCIEIENHLRISAASNSDAVPPSSWQSCLIEDCEEDEEGPHRGDMKDNQLKLENGNIKGYESSSISQMNKIDQNQSPPDSKINPNSFPSLAAVESTLFADGYVNPIQPVAPPPLSLNGILRGSSFTPLLLDAILNHSSIKDGVYERVKRGLDRGMLISREEFLCRLKRRSTIMLQNKKSHERQISAGDTTTTTTTAPPHSQPSHSQCCSLIELLHQISLHDISGVITAVLKEHALERDVGAIPQQMDNKSVSDVGQMIEGVDISILYDELSDFEIVLKRTSRVLVSAVNEALMPFLRSIIEALCLTSFPSVPYVGFYTDETAGNSISNTPLIPSFLRLAVSDMIGFIGELKREHLQLTALSNGNGKNMGDNSSIADLNSEVRNKDVNVEDGKNKPGDKFASNEIQENKRNVICSVFLLRYLCPLIMSFPVELPVPELPRSQSLPPELSSHDDTPRSQRSSVTSEAGSILRKSQWREKAVQMHQKHYYDHHSILMSMIAKYLQRAGSGQPCFNFNLNCVIYDEDENEVEEHHRNTSNVKPQRRQSTDLSFRDKSTKYPSSDGMKNLKSLEKTENTIKREENKDTVPPPPQLKKIPSAKRSQIFSHVKAAVHKTIIEELNPLIRDTLAPILDKLFSALSDPCLEQENVAKRDNINKFEYSDRFTPFEKQRVSDSPRLMGLSEFPIKDDTLKGEIIFTKMVQLLDPVLPYIANAMMTSGNSKYMLPEFASVKNRTVGGVSRASPGCSIFLPRLLKCCDYFHRRVKDIDIASKTARKLKTSKKTSTKPLDNEKKTREKVWKALVCHGTKGVVQPVITSHPHTFIIFAGLVPAFNPSSISMSDGSAKGFRNTGLNTSTISSNSSLDNSEEMEAVLVINGELLLLSENLCFGGPTGKRPSVGFSHSINHETTNPEEEKGHIFEDEFGNDTSNKKRTMILLEKMLPDSYKGVMVCRRHLVALRRQQHKQPSSQEQSTPTVQAHPPCNHNTCGSNLKASNYYFSDRADGDIVAYIAAYVDYFTQICNLKCRIVFIGAPCAASHNSHVNRNNDWSGSVSLSSTRANTKVPSDYVPPTSSLHIDANSGIPRTGHPIDDGINPIYSDNYVSDAASYTYYDGAWIRALFSRDGGVFPDKVLDKIGNIIIIERDEMSIPCSEEVSVAPSHGIINKTTQILSRIKKPKTLSALIDLNATDMTKCEGTVSTNSIDSSGRTSPTSQGAHFGRPSVVTVDLSLRCGCVPGTFPVDQCFRRKKTIKKSVNRLNELRGATKDTSEEDRYTDCTDSDDITKTIINFFPMCSHCGLEISTPDEGLSNNDNANRAPHHRGEYTDKALYFDSIRDAYLVACGGLVRKADEQCSSTANPQHKVMHPVKESIYRQLISTSLIGPVTMSLGLGHMEEMNNLEAIFMSSSSSSSHHGSKILNSIHGNPDGGASSNRSLLSQCMSRSTLVDIVRAFSYMFSVPSPTFLYSSYRRLKLYEFTDPNSKKFLDLEFANNSITTTNRKESGLFCKFYVSSIASLYPSPLYGHDVLNLMQETETGRYHNNIASSSSYLLLPCNEPRSSFKTPDTDSSSSVSQTAAYTQKRPLSPVPIRESSPSKGNGETDNGRISNTTNTNTTAANTINATISVPNIRPAVSRRLFDLMLPCEQRACTLCLWALPTANMPSAVSQQSSKSVSRHSSIGQNLESLTTITTTVPNTNTVYGMESSVVTSSQRQERASNSDKYWWWKSRNPVEDDLVELFFSSAMDGVLKLNPQENEGVLTSNNQSDFHYNLHNDISNSIISRNSIPTCTVFGFLDTNIQASLMKSFEERLRVVLIDNRGRGHFSTHTHQDNNNNNNNNNNNRGALSTNYTSATFDLKCAPVRVIWRLILQNMRSRWKCYNIRTSAHQCCIYSTSADNNSVKHQYNNTEADVCRNNNNSDTKGDQEKCVLQTSNKNVNQNQELRMSLQDFLLCSAVSLHFYCSSTSLNTTSVFHDIKGSQLFLFYVTRWITWLLLRNTGRQHQNIEMVVNGLNYMLSGSRLRLFTDDSTAGNNNNNKNETSPPNNKSDNNNNNNCEGQIVKDMNVKNNGPNESCFYEKSSSNASIVESSLNPNSFTRDTLPSFSFPSYKSLGDSSIHEHDLPSSSTVPTKLPEETKTSSHHYYSHHHHQTLHKGSSENSTTERSLSISHIPPLYKCDTLADLTTRRFDESKTTLSPPTTDHDQSSLPKKEKEPSLLLAPINNNNNTRLLSATEVTSVASPEGSTGVIGHSQQQGQQEVSFPWRRRIPDDQFFITSMYLSGAPLGYILYLEEHSHIKERRA